MYRYPEAMGRMVSWEKFTIIFKVFRDCWTILKEAKHTISTEGRVGGRVLLLDGGGGGDGLCVCILSRLVHHQLLYVSLRVYSI